jgi:hypothetical protein
MENSGTMRGRHHPWLSLTIFCVVLANGLPANAQSWLSDRKRAEGHGIRVGDFELHPGVGVEAGYTSNLFLADKDLASTASLRTSAHLFMSSLTGERIGSDQVEKRPWASFNGGLSGTFDHFFDYSKNDAIGSDILLDLTLAPGRPVGLNLNEAFNRSELPFSDTNLPAAQQRTHRYVDYTHYTEKAAAQLLFQTPGGLLKGSLGYRFNIIWFDDRGFRYNDNYTHTATFGTSWAFLPKSALFYEGTYSYQSYYNNNEMALVTSAYTTLFNNHQITSRIGINGAITARVGATISVGYGAGFFANNNDYNSFIGSVEGRYRPSDQSEVALVADRDFSPAYQGNFVERDRIYGRFRWLFSGAFLASAKAGVEFDQFGPDPAQGNRERSDRRYFADISGEYRFIDWLAATAQFTAIIDATDFVFQPPPGAIGAPDPAKYNVFAGWLGLRAFY